MQTTCKIRALLVDDHPCVLNGVCACLATQEYITVVGQAVNGLDALQKARYLLPDVVLMDLILPRMSGLEATRRMRCQVPRAKIIAYTVLNDLQMVEKARLAGASGYILKSSSLSELVNAIKAVHGGASFVLSGLPSRDFTAKAIDPKGERHEALYLITKHNQQRIFLCEEGAAGHAGLVKEAIDQISRKLSPLLTLKEIAAILHKDASDLDRLFWRETGHTIKEHVDLLCKQKIESALSHGDSKGSQIAFDLGFRDDQSFYKWIQRVFGMHFKELREKYSPKAPKINEHC